MVVTAAVGFQSNGSAATDDDRARTEGAQGVVSTGCSGRAVGPDKRACGNRGRSAVVVAAGEPHDAGGGLGQGSGSRKDRADGAARKGIGRTGQSAVQDGAAREGHRADRLAGGAEVQGCGVHRQGCGGGAERARAAERERAGGDRGCAGVAVAAREEERARAALGERGGAAFANGPEGQVRAVIKGDRPGKRGCPEGERVAASAGDVELPRADSERAQRESIVAIGAPLVHVDAGGAADGHVVGHGDGLAAAAAVGFQLNAIVGEDKRASAERGQHVIGAGIDRDHEGRPHGRCSGVAIGASDHQAVAAQQREAGWHGEHAAVGAADGDVEPQRFGGRAEGRLRKKRVHVARRIIRGAAEVDCQYRAGVVH